MFKYCKHINNIMRKRRNELVEQKKKEWIEFVKRNRNFFEELARKMKQ